MAFNLTPMKRITVFCGSSSGTEKVFEEQAYLLGKTIAQQGKELIYGGAKIGLMGQIANGALQNNGKVIGVLPILLQEKEVAHETLTELILVNNMHERKLKMYELCDGIIALPGGFGTMEELFEMLTWSQLGLHTKPIGLLNTGGFYTEFILMVEKMLTKGFIHTSHKQMLLISGNIDELLINMQNYHAPHTNMHIAKENV